MKKALSLILALVLCFSLGACGDSADAPSTADDINNGINGEIDNGDSESNNVDTSWVVQGESINVAKLRECLEIVELTTENWKEHFKVYSWSYTEEKVERDAFGEVVSTETITHNGRAFGAGNERYHLYKDVVIELQDKATGELYVYDLRDGHSSYNDLIVEENFSLDDYECTRIKGCIYYLNFSIGELPVGTYLWPEYMVDGMNALIMGALYVAPGTNAIQCEYIDEWLS